MAVTTQPQGKKQEIEAFVRDLDPLTVQGRPTSTRPPRVRITAERSPPPTLPAEWSPDDVVQKYLKPINMEYLAKPFVENRINGAVLLGIEER